MFEVLEHTADIGLRAWGKTKEELFENAAIGMVSLAVEIEDVEPRIAYPIAASGTDLDSLLVNWLGEVLYYLDAQHVVLIKFHAEQSRDRTSSARLGGNRAIQPATGQR